MSKTSETNQAQQVPAVRRSELVAQERRPPAVPGEKGLAERPPSTPAKREAAPVAVKDDNPLAKNGSGA